MIQTVTEGLKKWVCKGAEEVCSLGGEMGQPWTAVLRAWRLSLDGQSTTNRAPQSAVGHARRSTVEYSSYEQQIGERFGTWNLFTLGTKVRMSPWLSLCDRSLVAEKRKAILSLLLWNTTWQCLHLLLE
jgi:hypothetical protein